MEYSPECYEKNSKNKIPRSDELRGEIGIILLT